MFLPKFKKDRLNRYKFYKFESQIRVKKFIINSTFFISEVRVKARYELFRLYDKFSVGYNYTNRCIITGHSRVPFRKFKVSRMEFRRLAKIGVLKGLTKSSWLYFIVMKSFSNLVSHIRNAGAVQNSFTLVPLSVFNLKALDIFYKQGIIVGYSIYDVNRAKVFISYLPNGVSLAGSLKVVSCPSRRVYITWKKLINYYSGIFCLVSTSRGLLTGTEAIRLRIGGELVCSRFYY